MSININVITLTSKLDNLKIEVEEAAANFPLDDCFTVGCFYGHKNIRIDRLYTGTSIPTKSFPRSFIIHIDTGTNPVVVKLYNNGVLHLTGCTSEQQGNDICVKLADICNQNEIVGITKIGSVVAEPCEIKMINGCCCLDYQLRKSPLATTLKESGYRVHNTDISPALKLWYMWNTKSKRPGICDCENYCSEGKGDGKGPGQCNRTTISILHTGVIHFMGSRYEKQMIDAHASIIEFMEKNKDKFSRINPKLLMKAAMQNNSISQLTI